MEKPSEAQQRVQGQQIPAQPARPQPSAQQPGAFAAQNKKKRKAEKLLDSEMQRPPRRPEAPSSIRAHNPPYPQQGQTIIPAPDDRKHNPSVLISEANPGEANTDLRQELRKEIRKEMETEWESKLAESTLKVENLWRKKWEQKAEEVEMHYIKKLKEVESHHNNDDIRALHEEIDKLKKRLLKGPSLIKAAEERGRREGELDGYNKLSLNPDLKPSQDRQNFDYLMKEKNKELADVRAVRDSWFNDARKFSEETNAKIRDRDHEIQRLQAELQNQPRQQPRAPDNTDALIAEGRALQFRFDSQTQELLSLREYYNQQATETAKLRDLLQKKSIESRNYERQSVTKSNELILQSEELRRMTEEVSILRRENDQKSVQLKDINEEFAKTWGQLKKQRVEHYNNWLELGVYERQIEAQSKEIASLRARRHRQDEAQSKETASHRQVETQSKETASHRQVEAQSKDTASHRQVEAQSKETAGLRPRHGDSESSQHEKDRIIAGLRELLDKSNPHQSTKYGEEEAKRLRRRLAKSDRKLAESESRLNASLIENTSLRQNQDRIKKATKFARDKGRMARIQASISWSHLKHAGRILNEQNAALAAVWLDKSALEERVRELEAQLGRATSTLEDNRTELKDAEEKAAELVAANRRVAELEAEKEEMKSQDSGRTSSGPTAMPLEFFSHNEPVPIKRFGKYRHKPSPANETRGEHRLQESASDDAFRRVLGIKKAES